MRITVLIAAMAALPLGACGGPKPVTEAEAANIADETQTAWASRNLPAIESRYSKTVVGLDPAEPALITTWEKFDTIQKAFARQLYDTVSVPQRRIQILDEDTFVVSGIGSMKKLADAKSEVHFRFTDVYRRETGGPGFVIVNEHVSLQPKP